MKKWVSAMVALLLIQQPLMVVAADDPAAVAPSATPAVPADDDEREVCRPDEKASGTRLSKTKTCRTKSEWTQLQQQRRKSNGRAETERLQREAQDMRSAASP